MIRHHLFLACRCLFLVYKYLHNPTLLHKNNTHLFSLPKMKPHSLSGDHASLTHESKRTFGVAEKLKLQACDAGRNNGVVGKGNTSTSSCSLMFSNENQRRNWSYVAEDPIRTMMFFASWGHTWLLHIF